MNIEMTDNRDQVKGAISSFGAMLLLFIVLKLISYSQTAPKDPLEMMKMDETPDEITMQKFETSAAKGGGSGQPTDADLTDKYMAQTEKTLRDPNSESDQTSAKGESNHSNQNADSDNKASTTVDSDLAFRSGGDGGGDKGGRGKGFGNDTGGGIGPGNNGGKKARIRLNNPNTDGIESDQNCKIILKLSVNSEGNVIKAENVVSQTTTMNQVLISQVKANVLAQVKYNKVEGAAIEIQYLTVNLLAK